MPARRFPPPWDIEEANASCFIVKDNNGQALAYVYFESDPGRRMATNLLTREEARRIPAAPDRRRRSTRCLNQQAKNPISQKAYPSRVHGNCSAQS